MERSDGHRGWVPHVVARRRLLGGAAGLGASAVALAACGGSGKSGASGGTGAAGGGSTAAAAVSAGQPKPGGILKGRIGYDADTLDPIATKNYKADVIAAYVYSRLLKFKATKGQFADGTLEADAATAWEQPDPQTLIFHLRQGMKFDQRPPTNGRPLTAADVVASWEKFTAEAVYRTDIVNAASKTAPVLSLTATDPSTISLTLAFPDAQLLPSLNFWGGLWILPKEAHGGGLDPKTDMRGSGPWTLEKYTPSVGFSLKKNPNYYAAPQYPLMDGVELPIISDTAQAEAQFKAKNVIWGEFNSTVVPVTDILSIQSGVKDTRIDLGAPDVTGPSISFSWREGQPFKDERVRQAISMLIDRDTFIEVFYDLKNFQAAGVKMRGYWLAPYGAGYGPFWLDPKDAKFGASAKYLTYDVGEAKKLLAAAGHPNGFETTMTFVAGTTYGADWPQRAEALASMLAKGGIKASLNPIDYTSVWVPQYLRAHGDFDGMAMYPNGARGDPGQWLFVFLHSAGANNQAGTNFPDLDALIEKQRRELDRDKRIEIFHDIQRYCTAHMVIAPQGGHTESPALSWKGLHGPDEYHPWPGNQSFGVELVPYVWTDDTLRG